MLNIKTNNKIILKLFEPIDIELLVLLSDIDNTYLDYPDENLEPGSIMQLLYCPGGIYLECGGRVYLSEDSEKYDGRDVEMIEGIHFKFI